MTLLVLSFLAGVLTIVAPCILPVLPFVFSRVDQPFVRNGLPTLLGLATSFAIVASLAAIGGGWVVQANEVARWIALAVLGLFGLTLLVPRIAERWTAPLAALGARLAAPTPGDDERQAIGRSFLLGGAIGLLWAPCAGPVLGLVLTAAALNGASGYTTLLLFAYAAGAATSMAAALWAGRRVYRMLGRSIRALAITRRALGAAVVAGVALIALGVDTQVVARLTPESAGTRLEEFLFDRFAPKAADVTSQAAGFSRVARQGTAAVNPVLAVEGHLPELAGATAWLNSPPLSRESLKGKVVLIDFWTFACINCQHALPYVRAWHEKYKDQGLVVIGVHSPEFAYERNIDNVRRAAKDMGLGFPIAIDNDFTIWRSFANRYWPAHYFIDAQGRIRFHHFGEGAYERSEEVIRQLLQEAAQQRRSGST